MNEHPKLQYNGKFEWPDGEDGRQWTIMSHWIDANGYDRYHGTFALQGLKELGVI